VLDHPGRVAAVEMHVYLFSPMYFQEVFDRWHYYPPPDNGNYSYPWLWFDGNPHGGWVDSTWHAKIENRLSVPAPFTITTWGTYNSGSGSGTIYARYRNDSTAAITARSIFVVTEDSIYYAGTNGDTWHNHVARDYIPDQNGQTITIPAADSVTINRSFTIQNDWNANRCKILTWLQSDNMLPDSTKPIFQGAIKRVSDLVAVEESSLFSLRAPGIQVYPNPAHRLVSFNLNLPAASYYSILVFDPTGRQVESFSGSTKTDHETLTWNLDQKMNNGVYFLKFRSKTDNYLGKIIIAD
jgi:hypothetical protein